MDVLTKDQRRKNMQAIKNKGTRIEIFLAKALWAKGLRYRKNDKSVFGKPDLTFKRHKIAVFCDSEFFHGYNWDVNRESIKSNREFWISKIEGNIRRDEVVNKALYDSGWIVLRFWGNEIKKQLPQCVEKIVFSIQEREI